MAAIRHLKKSTSNKNRPILQNPAAGLRSRSRSRKKSEVFGWSRIPNNTGSRSRIFCTTPTPAVQLDYFLHQTPKLRIPVEMAQFLLKLLLKQRFIAVHHDFPWF